MYSAPTISASGNNARRLTPSLGNMPPSMAPGLLARYSTMQRHRARHSSLPPPYFGKYPNWAAEVVALGAELSQFGDFGSRSTLHNASPRVMSATVRAGS